MQSRIDIQRLLESAVALQRAGRLGEAEPIYRRVLGAQPRNTDALYLLGLITQGTGRFAESAELFQRAVRENPKSAKYWVNLGLCLGGMGLGRTEEALEAFRTAVAIDATIPAAWSNLGNEFLHSLQFDEAIDAYQRALRLKPDFADPQCNYGSALQETLPTLEPAIAAYEKAIEMQFDFPQAHWNLGWALLLSGDYARGLAEYEWRLRVRHIVPPRQFREPRWDGGSLAGKQILLHAEQGLGDTIHMARYVPLVAARGGQVILEVPAPLVRLLRGVAGVAEIVTGGQALPKFDLQCPLMSLPLILGTRLETISQTLPAGGAYLKADAELSAAWAKRLPPDANRPRIGLAWAGRPENKVDRKRSMRLEQLGALGEIKSARFVSLQKGPASEQLRRLPGGMEVMDAGRELGDFADTAALVENLDLVIAVDTSVAHLAGALGRPVWVLLPYRPDWRWLMDREDSPWYPTARLFRQRVRGDWGEVVQRVRAELSKMGKQA